MGIQSLPVAEKTTAPTAERVDRDSIPPQYKKF